MASQLRRVTGNRRLTSDPRAALQAKIANLPNRLAQQQQREVIKRDTRFQNKQIALQKKSAAQRRREQEATMGLEASKLGMNLAMSDLGGKTIGDVTGGVKALKNKVMGTEKTSGIQSTGPKQPTGNAVKDFNIGGAISSGLTGYGVGKLVGGKSKAKKSMFGGGAGALMGLLSANKGGGLSGLLSGGLSGALGGYFS